MQRTARPELCSWQSATTRSPDPTNQVTGADYTRVRLQRTCVPCCSVSPKQEGHRESSVCLDEVGSGAIPRLHSWPQPTGKAAAWEGTSQRHREGSEKSQPHRRTVNMLNSSAAARTVPRGRGSKYVWSDYRPFRTVVGDKGGI